MCGSERLGEGLHSEAFCTEHTMSAKRDLNGEGTYTNATHSIAILFLTGGLLIQCPQFVIPSMLSCFLSYTSNVQVEQSTCVRNPIQAPATTLNTIPPPNSQE